MNGGPALNKPCDVAATPETATTGVADTAIFLSIREASRRLGVRRSAFYQHILQPGLLHTVRIGRRRLVHRDDLAKFAETLRTDATAEAGVRDRGWPR